jgi:hypothetical protein
MEGRLREMDLAEMETAPGLKAEHLRILATRGRERGVRREAGENGAIRSQQESRAALEETKRHLEVKGERAGREACLIVRLGSDGPRSWIDFPDLIEESYHLRA